MDFLTLPPEVNSARVYTGVGSRSMLAVAAAWDGLVDDLGSAAASFRSLTLGLSAEGWQGPSSAAMVAAAAPYVGWLDAAAGRAQQTAAQARVMVAAFETVFAATVDPAVVAANRAQLVSLAASNAFGQNAAAIAAAEAEYERMWADDVAAMVGYHAAASVAAGHLTPWQLMAQSLPGQDPGAAELIRITVPGAAQWYLAPKSLLEIAGVEQWYAGLNLAMGANWFPGTTPEVANYPAGLGLFSGSPFAPNTNQSVAIGQQILNTDIFNAAANGKSLVVAGESEGAVVIDREEAFLAGNPSAPPPSQLTFVEFADPQRGLADTYFRPGATIPGFGYTVREPAVSQYHTDVVYSQYDGWADPPNRPWNLLADVNAVAGVEYLHVATEFASPSQVVEVSAVTNSLGGTTTTYMIPTPTLPLLMPLQQLGVPAPIVSVLNQVLMPIVNEGYSQYDPNGGPYFSQGNLVW